MDTKVPVPTLPISRRTVLVAAGTGAAGMAAARLLSLRDAAPRATEDVTKAAAGAGLDWVSPLDKEPAQVAHLLRRAAFGASGADLEKAVSNGYARTVDRLIETPAEEPLPLPGGETATRSAPLRLAALQQWWLDHLVVTPTPLIEAMTLFWHGHFTSDYRKVGLQSPFMYWQNQTWRKFALGDLRTMLMQVTIDSAMLRYLDLGTSTGSNPNENYSRELMELFTIGAGTFTEDDVRAGAKALSGWREPITAAMVKDLQEDAAKKGITRRFPNPDDVNTGVYDAKRAYNGSVTFLGKTGKLDTQAVLDRILEQPATAPFITRKVVRHFVTPNPDDAYVRRLAERFRASGYSVKSLLRDVFLSPEFLDASSYRALVKSPIEYMVSAIRALGALQLAKLALGSGQGMGQVLFDPPDVGGWPSNESWISSNTVLARVNFATAAIQQVKKLPSIEQAVAQQLDAVVSPQTASLLNGSKDDKSAWILLLASPEFQLK